MEQFQQIDWTTNVEDIVDEKFINEERLQNEGAMYKIVNGSFQDPFQHLRKFAPNATNEQQAPANKQQPKKFTNQPSLGVAMKRRGRPKRNA